MKQIDQQELSEVIKSSETILVDFFAEWCGPCKALKPTLNELAKDYPVFSIDVEQNDEATITYNIRSMPTLIYFKDGKEVKRLVGGGKTKSELSSNF